VISEVKDMKNNNSHTLSQFYDQLVTEFDDKSGIMWCYMNPHPRPCFNPQLLKDLNRFLQLIKKRVKSDIFNHGTSEIKYIVFGSYKPGVFSLGGDLRLFLDCIHENDKDRLTEYMRLSIDVMYSIYSNMNVPVTTISLIRGNALGAGFEGALSCDYIVAESGVQLGFPEVLFNMFPGMGAYSFLSRRLDSTRVEKMILSGRIYSVEELYEIGLIDFVTSEHRGAQGVEDFIQKINKTKNTRKAVLKMRSMIHPVTYEEMIKIGELWVDCAMSLSTRELKVMSRLIRSQDKIYSSMSDVQNLNIDKIV
jgi:DSF synthase